LKEPEGCRVDAPQQSESEWSRSILSRVDAPQQSESEWSRSILSQSRNGVGVKNFRLHTPLVTVSTTSQRKALFCFSFAFEIYMNFFWTMVGLRLAFKIQCRIRIVKYDNLLISASGLHPTHSGFKGNIFMPMA